LSAYWVNEETQHYFVLSVQLSWITCTSNKPLGVFILELYRENIYSSNFKQYCILVCFCVTVVRGMSNSFNYSLIRYWYFSIQISIMLSCDLAQRGQNLWPLSNLMYCSQDISIICWTKRVWSLLYFEWVNILWGYNTAQDSVLFREWRPSHFICLDEVLLTLTQKPLTMLWILTDYVIIIFSYLQKYATTNKQ